MEKVKERNFIREAGILAAAGIVVRIIGILYRTPLVMIIGDEGNGYYNTAYNIYAIILFISSYSIPAALSKIIAARLGLGEYRNAFRLFIGSIVYVIIMGGIGSSVCFFFAGSFVGANSASVLRFFAPTIFLSGLLGCFRGFFQAQQTFVYTSVSQILEQIANAAVSIGGAYLITRALIGGTATQIAIGGATGSALGTGAGVLTALIFMVIIYSRRRAVIHAKVREDKTERILTPRDIARTILGIVTPVILSTCIYNLSTVVNLKFYQELSMRLKGMSEVIATTRYGLFSGKATNIINIPIAMGAAMSSAVIPAVSRSFERGEIEEVRNKIGKAIKVTMLIAIPCGFGLFVLSKPVTLLLYPQKESVDLVSQMIKVLAVTVVFYCLSTLSNAVLQGAGFVQIPVINAAIALVIQSVAFILMVIYTNLDTFALCIATIIYSLLMCILNSRAMKKKSGYKQEVVKTFMLPSVASIIMAVVVAIVYRLVYTVTGNIIALFTSVIIGGLIYGCLIIILKVADESELSMLPKGRTLVAMLRRRGLL